MLVMLDGWIDAAGAAAAAMGELSSACESSPVLSFDDDVYIDYRARRPTMELRNGLNTNLAWSTIEMRSGRTPSGRDVLFLVGPEPDMAWRRFGRAVATLAIDFGVTKMVSLGAYPFAAPHTRPARLSVSSPSTECAVVGHLRSQFGRRPRWHRPECSNMRCTLRRSRHSGSGRRSPTTCRRWSIPPPASRCWRDWEEATGISIDALGLRHEVTEHRSRLDRMIAEKSEHESMVRQLEELHDLAIEQESDPSEGPDDLELRSGDELAEEIQAFFRDQP